MQESLKYHKTSHELKQEAAQIKAALDDPRKFEVLYNRYFEQIFRFIYQRVESKQDAADLTSQVFFKALSNLKSYKDKGLPFSAWLYRIALNEVNSFFTSNEKKRTIAIDDSAILSMTEDFDSEAHEDLFPLVSEALQELDADELLLIEMRFFEQRPFREMGDILQITENNAKVKTYRVIEKMKNLIVKQH